MNVLIVGAAGYIGGAIATAAQRAGHEVAGLRHPGGHTLPEGVKAVDGDLTDAASLTIAAKGFDRVVHVGPPLGEETDLAGVDALTASGVPVIYTTGAAVLGSEPSDEDTDPDPHPLIRWRAEAERRVLAAGGQVVRPGMVYGNGGGLIAGLLAPKAAEQGVGVYIGEPGVRWPVVHAEDLADLYVTVLDRTEPGIWHGMSETVRLDELAAALGEGRTASWPLEEARAEIGGIADLFVLDQQISSTKTRNHLDWHPAHTSLLDWLRTQS
ncbi:NAD-dependent epimerase/dehydratase family protein [Nonomuraea sp. NPDC050691]|uniref:NAD-dependent epimerase/dehydratase family protein n=1 Tax=Nonomuraea sp. NPDC050691 TaxID=3155661 RepID=UPI0033D8E49E